MGAGLAEPAKEQIMRARSTKRAPRTSEETYRHADIASPLGKTCPVDRPSHWLKGLKGLKSFKSLRGSGGLKA